MQRVYVTVASEAAGGPLYPHHIESSITVIEPSTRRQRSYASLSIASPTLTIDVDRSLSVCFMEIVRPEDSWLVDEHYTMHAVPLAGSPECTPGSLQVGLDLLRHGTFDDLRVQFRTIPARDRLHVSWDEAQGDLQAIALSPMCCAHISAGAWIGMEMRFQPEMTRAAPYFERLERKGPPRDLNRIIREPMDDALVESLVREVQEAQVQVRARWEDYVANTFPDQVRERDERKRRQWEEDRVLHERYGGLYDEMLAVFTYYAPLGTVGPEARDAARLYMRNVRHLIDRVATARSGDEVLDLVAAEFYRPQLPNLGPRERYVHVADAIWRAVRRVRASG